MPWADLVWYLYVFVDVFQKIDVIEEVVMMVSSGARPAMNARRCAVLGRSKWYLQSTFQWNQLLLPSVIQTLALILILALGLSEAVISDDLIVNTSKGKIRGVTLKSATNKWVVFKINRAIKQEIFFYFRTCYLIQLMQFSACIWALDLIQIVTV